MSDESSTSSQEDNDNSLNNLIADGKVLREAFHFSKEPTKQKLSFRGASSLTQDTNKDDESLRPSSHVCIKHNLKNYLDSIMC